MLLCEIFQTDEEGLKAKGWYNPTIRKWVEVPYTWHHSNYPLFHPEFFPGFDAQSYLDNFESARMLIPKYDQEVIDALRDLGWYRIGFSVNRNSVYCVGKLFKDAQKTLRYYIKNIFPMPEDRIERVSIESENHNYVSGSLRQVLMTK